MTLLSGQQAPDVLETLTNNLRPLLLEVLFVMLWSKVSLW